MQAGQKSVHIDGEEIGIFQHDQHAQVYEEGKKKYLVPFVPCLCADGLLFVPR